MTYGDGITNLNLNKLLKFHKTQGKIATVTAVRPPVKFGEMKIGINKKTVNSFLEKPNLNSGWINGGFFVLNKNVFKYIKNFHTIFERQPLVSLSKKKQLVAFEHKSYWRCMDNLNEKEQLDKIYKKYKSLWKIK